MAATFDCRVVELDSVYHPALQRFYRQAGHRVKIGAAERVIALARGDNLEAALRLVPEGEDAWLRGLWVMPALRGQGQGSRLLQALPAYLGRQPCYCLAHDRAVNFYQRNGFTPLVDDALPAPLRQRLVRYRRREPSLVPLRLTP